jgi:hypothetical protein
MKTPIQDAFDAILDLMKLAQERGPAFTDEEHRKYMDVARGLLEPLSHERRENEGFAGSVDIAM